MEIKLREGSGAKTNIAVNVWKTDADMIKNYCKAKNIRTSVVLRSMFAEFIEANLIELEQFKGE